MKISDYLSISESLRRSVEINQMLVGGLTKIADKQREIDSTLQSFSGASVGLQTMKPFLTVPENKIIKALGEIAVSIQGQNYAFGNPMLERINAGITNMVQAFGSYASNILDKSTSEFWKSVGESFYSAMESPVIGWLQTIDMTPIVNLFEQLQLDEEILKHYKELNQIYLTVMFECKWFPYAAWIADDSLNEEVSGIIATSRGASKRREKRIDKVVCSYYTPQRIRAIKRSWRSLELEAHIKRILGQAIEAHLRGEYALCISSLSTLWEGLIYTRANDASMQERHRRRMEVTKKEFADLTEANDYDKIFSDYFDHWIVSQCNKVEDVVDGVPNRHGVSHSWYSSYPNKKASLNAILLTDFIVHLETKKDPINSII